MNDLEDNLSTGPGKKPEPPLTRLVLRQAGVIKTGWQYELPLNLPGNVMPDDIICGINPVTKEPDLTIHYLVKAVGEDGKVAATRIEETDEPQLVVFEQTEVFRVAAAFKSNL